MLNNRIINEISNKKRQKVNSTLIYLIFALANRYNMNVHKFT